MEANTQTEAIHLLDKVEVGLQASLLKPSLVRKKDTGYTILSAKPRSLSTKRKHPRKKHMRVSEASVNPIPIITTTTKEVGTSPRDSRGFREIVERARITCGIKRPEPIRRKNNTTGVPNSKIPQIRPANPIMVNAILKKEKSQTENNTLKNHEPSKLITKRIKNKWLNLFGDEEGEPNLFEMQISKAERKEIEKMGADKNNNME